MLFNGIMETIGDRIRRARIARGWSAQKLAQLAGYRTQSGITNLEHRATGSGGHKIAHIANVLKVPLGWLLNGGDNGEVPLLSFVHPPSVEIMQRYQLGEPSPPPYSTAQESRTDKLLRLWATLDDKAKDALLERIEFFVAAVKKAESSHA